MANRKAPRTGDTKFPYVGERTILDGAYVYVGTMVQQDDSTLEVAPATALSGKFVMGLSTKEVDNSDDGKTLNFIEGSVLGMDNDGSITRASIGDVCYVVNSETVSVSAASAATTNIAGRINDVDSTHVHVDFDPAKKG